MSRMNKFMRWHPIGSAFLIIFILLAGVVSGCVIFKFFNPNTVFFNKAGLNYRNEIYQDLPGQWEFVEEPDQRLGKIYNSKHGIVSYGGLYSFSDDSNMCFVKDKGDAGIFGEYPIYFSKKELPFDQYDASEITKIVIEHNDSALEITSQQEVVRMAAFLKEPDIGTASPDEPLTTGVYDYVYIYYKNYGVRYNAGTLKEGFETGDLYFDKKGAEKTALYPVPSEISNIISERRANKT